MPGTDPSNLASTIEFLLEQTPGESPSGATPTGSETLEVTQDGAGVSLTIDQLLTRAEGLDLRLELPSSAGNGGGVSISSGAAATGFVAGNVSINASNGGTDGGGIDLTAGTSTDAVSSGGTVRALGGRSDTASGGTVYARGGSTHGGNIEINSGGGDSGNTAAGDIVLTTGTPSGSGAQGLISLQSRAWKGLAVTVANLPAAATAGAGARAFVTDANTTIILGIGTTVVGTGSNKVPVYSDGSAWKIG